jgi:DNA-binding transcriptional LysR family regulator
LQLTPAGKAFLNEARLALTQAERARQATRANTDRLTLGFLLRSEIDLTIASDDHIARRTRVDGAGHAQ